MTEKKNVKILVGYHKPAVIIKNDFFVPIHVGRLANAKSKDGNISDTSFEWLKENMIGDDTGENISDTNRFLCEVTALYWAWKNYDKLGNPDYIGFMHYRRHLIFNADNKKLKKQKKDFSIYHFNDFQELYGKDGYKNEEKISELVSNYDILHSNIVTHNKTVLEQFRELTNKPFDLNKDLFDLVISTLKREKPEYAKAINRYLYSTKYYWYNCFVMSKELFFEYAEFSFDILLKIHKQTSYENFSTNGCRTLAYISERLLGIFLTQKIFFENKKIKYLPLALVEYTDEYKIPLTKRIKKEFQEKTVKIKKLIKYIRTYI